MKKLLLFMLAVVAGATAVRAQADETIPEDAIVVLDYIKSTGQQAFNTNYVHTSTTMVVMGCVIEQDHQRNYEALFGARLTSFHNNAFCFFSRFNGQDVPCYNRSGNEKTGSGLPYNRYVEVAAMGQMAAWGTEEEGMIGSVTTSGAADDGKTPMLIFNLNTATTAGGVQIDTSPCCMSLYEFKIYEGDYNLKHSFVPAKVRGVIGLYDRLTGEFGGSITSTPFVAGPQKSIIYPIRIVSTVGGEVKPDNYALEEGSWGGFTITRNPGYGIQSISLKDNDGNDVDYTLAQEEGGKGLYFFQMPKGGANLSVVFKAIPRGDVNGDIDVTIADFVAVLNAMAGGEVNGNADVNGDSQVTIADGVAILNIMAGGGSSSAGSDDSGGDQGGDTGDGGEKIYDVAEIMPEFPGGAAAMLQWIQNTMCYPQVALDDGVQGRVIVQFVVEKDGTRSNVKVMRSIDERLNPEAIRLVNAMPKWTPAKQNGQVVRCRFTLPITFRLP